MKTLKIGVAGYERMKARRMEIARGERERTAGAPSVWFVSVESFARALSRRNRGLPGTIAREKPASLAELATLAGRNESNLSRAPGTMSRQGLVESRKGRRGALVPRVPYDRVSLDLSLKPSPRRAA